MKKLVASVLLIISLTMLANAAFAWRQSDYPAKFTVPSVIRLDKQKTIPIQLEVRTPDGQPYSGEVVLDAQYGRFITTEGERVFPRFPVQAVNGRVFGTISLEDKFDAPYPLKIFAYRGSDEVLAQAEIVVLFPADYKIFADIPTVAADGGRQPRIKVAIFDQHGKVLPEVDFEARYQGPQNLEWQGKGQTDSTGVGRLILPASATVGYAHCQVVNDFIATPQVKLLYTDEPMAWLPLRETLMERGYRVYWDETTHRVLVRGARGRAIIHPEEAFAEIDHQSIPMGAPTKVIDGRLHVPAIFLDNYLRYGG